MSQARHQQAIERLVRARNWQWYGDWLEVGGRPVHYLVRGEGPPVVLVHGVLAWSYTWRKNLGAIAGAGYRVLAPDLLGHGFSDRTRGLGYTLDHQTEMLAGFLRTLAGRPAILVGHSMGGDIALRLAVRYPELLQALVLVSAAGYLQGGVSANLLRALRLPGAAAFTRLALFTRRFTRKQLEYTYGNPGLISVGDVLGYLLPSRVPGTARALIDMARQLEFGREIPRYRDIVLPSLVIWGARDRVVPVEHAHRFAQELAGSRLSVYPGAGHVPPEEEPERFNREILEFLGQVG